MSMPNLKQEKLLNRISELRREYVSCLDPERKKIIASLGKMARVEYNIQYPEPLVKKAEELFK